MIMPVASSAACFGIAAARVACYGAVVVGCREMGGEAKNAIERDKGGAE
ncbi:MAG: hypothetical protein GF363_07530 [Chitinivibrionales bacterium]|nr:hypothetical protein [Chitinivibrionales bacterium]